MTPPPDHDHDHDHDEDRGAFVIPGWFVKVFTMLQAFVVAVALWVGTLIYDLHSAVHGINAEMRVLNIRMTHTEKMEDDLDDLRTEVASLKVAIASMRANDSKAR